MNKPKTYPDHLPILTELLKTPVATDGLMVPASTKIPTPDVMEEGVVEDMAPVAKRVQDNVQMQLNNLLEANLREVMAPLLAQQTDILVRHLKVNMSQTLTDMVARAVEQEITKQKR